MKYQTLWVLKVTDLICYINHLQVLLRECIYVEGAASVSLAFIWFFFFFAVSQF